MRTNILLILWASCMICFVMMAGCNDATTMDTIISKQDSVKRDTSLLREEALLRYKDVALSQATVFINFINYPILVLDNSTLCDDLSSYKTLCRCYDGNGHAQDIIIYTKEKKYGIGDKLHIIKDSY